MTDIAINVDNVSKRFRIYKTRNNSLKSALLSRNRGKYDDFWAVNGVSLQIPKGTTYGLLGHNGSGKSTLLKCIARILTPDKGTITSNGRMAAMLEVGSGFHPELTGRENAYLNGAILGMSRDEIHRKMDEIIEFSGVGDFIDQPVKNYSSGMYVRLGFSVSIHVEPDILLVDEILAVGDLEFQERCLDKFAQFRAQGRTVVVVSHSLDQMKTFCDEAAWLKNGHLVDSGNAAEIVTTYSATEHQAREVELGGTRFGSGEIQIERIEFLDDDDTDVRTATTGDRRTIRLHYRASQRITKPVFGVSIDTREGYFVWGHHGMDDGFVPTVIEAGEGSLDVTIPWLPLRPNTYTISASIQGPDLIQMYDAWQKAITFDVMPSQVMESGGVVAFQSHFGNLQPPVPMEKATQRYRGAM